MYKWIDVDDKRIHVPAEVTEDMVREVLDAGWSLCRDDNWSTRLPESMYVDRFRKVSEIGALHKLIPVIRENGKLRWQLGTAYLVDHHFPEYCTFYTTVTEALAQKLD